LAKLLAERIVRQRLDQQPEMLLALARTALDKFRRARQTHLFVHPSQVQRLRRHLPSLGFAEGTISVEASEQLPVGDLRVISDLGDLTFSINGQLDRLVRALRQDGA
jgi:flagellar biosynthesis/type III secretory pathway protein FliH